MEIKMINLNRVRRNLRHDIKKFLRNDNYEYQKLALVGSVVLSAVAGSVYTSAKVNQE